MIVYLSNRQYAGSILSHRDKPTCFGICLFAHPIPLQLHPSGRVILSLPEICPKIYLPSYNCSKPASTRGSTSKVRSCFLFTFSPAYVTPPNIFTSPAETTLREQERQPGFSIALLQITASNSYPINSRLASALFFKNFIKRSWVVCHNGGIQVPPTS